MDVRADRYRLAALAVLSERQLLGAQVFRIHRQNSEKL
jgi:hypothetical protein